MRVGLFGKNFPSSNGVYLQQLVHSLEASGAMVFIYRDFYNETKNFINYTKTPVFFSSHEEIKERLDFLVSIGGDGTYLDTIKLVRDSKIPVVGINTGRLGFLSSISKDEIGKAIRDITHGDYVLEKRSLLRLETSNGLFGDLNFALNEVTITKKDTSSMITIHSYMNDEYLNSYWADGLIIATPTGSTAYSLSCGGPIVHPESENFVITPIAPHNLNVRPVIIPDHYKLKFKVEGRSEHFLVGLDSRSVSIDASVELTIVKENFYLNFVRLKDHGFLTTIRNKLMWGLDKRN